MEEVQREGNLGKRRHEILENTHTMKLKRQLNHFLTIFYLLNFMVFWITPPQKSEFF